VSSTAFKKDRFWDGGSAVLSGFWKHFAGKHGLFSDAVN
jgi:hypothetical protein